MHKLNKITALLLAVIMLLTLNACGMAEEKVKEDNTIRITLGRYDSSNLEKALLKQFPDINFEFEYYKGFATTEYYRSQILNDETGDVFISTLKFEDEICKQHLMDLSGYSFVGNFENSILNQYDIDGAIYFLPGPIMVRSMAYNKTLFEEYGWKAPTNHDELVQLVKQIRAESDLTPISFGAKGLGYYFTTMTTLSQTAYLAKAQGTTWEEAYLAGEVSCREGFEPGIEMVEELIEADAYDIEIDVANNDEWAMQRFVEREAAMITIWGWQSKFIEKLENSEDELVLLPFYNRDGESFLGTNVSFHTGLPKRLEEKGNEKSLQML